MEVSGVFHALAALPLEKFPVTHLGRPGGRQSKPGRFGKLENSLPLPGIASRSSIA